MIGVVGGDLKPDNVDLVLKGDKHQIGIIDFDDGGRGALIGDLLHTLVYNQAWHVPVDTSQALQFYKAGLNQESNPQFVNTKVDLNEYKKRKKKFENQLEKQSKDKSNFFKSLKLIELSDLQGPQRDLFLKTSSEIKNEVLKLGRVIFEGARTKESGGSKGVLRVTYLIRTEQNELKIIEFKHQTQAAVAMGNVTQLNHAPRLHEIKNFYRPDLMWGNILRLLETNGETFIVREKSEPIFDGQKAVKSASERTAYEAYVYNMFFWLGYAHGAQSTGYKSFWTQNSEALEIGLVKMVQAQITEAIQVVNSNPESRFF